MVKFVLLGEKELTFNKEDIVNWTNHEKMIELTVKGQGTIYIQDLWIMYYQEI